MPYINISTSKKLSDAQKEKIKAELGRLIAIIPTKAEAYLMVDFSDERTFYKAGQKVEGVFIDLRLFHKSDFEPKKKFTEETLKMLSGELGIKEENFNLTIMEFDNWGSGGTLKS
jgi:phenylpyruvate tautomerase PptA (4-oxalocrotonate tautomerase family)